MSALRCVPALVVLTLAAALPAAAQAQAQDDPPPVDSHLSGQIE